jgi:formylglycine-generating enzyme required for sulfatase activity
MRNIALLLIACAAAGPLLAQTPGAKKVNAKDGLTYVWVPPGKFMMGCSPGDADCSDYE